MNQSFYDEFSRDYDRFVNWKSRLAAEIPFIEKQINPIKTGKQRKPAILDAACGSGMHAIELARKGFSACGADISPKMIKLADLNARASGVNVLFKEAFLGNLSYEFNQAPDFPFDMIICMGNSLPHLLTKELLQSALIDMAACLSPRGQLILQHRNFDAILKKRERWFKPQSYKEKNEEWIFIRFYDFDADGLITFNILRLHHLQNNEWQQDILSTRLYPLKQDFLVDLLQDCGFSNIRCFGQMDEIAFNPNSSENLVITARKV